MQTIGNRIREIKNFYFGSERESNKKFADTLNVSQQTAANWFNRGNGIGEKVITQILTAFPDVDRGWLVGGNGFMLAADNEKIRVNLLDTRFPVKSPENAPRTDEANVTKLADSFEDLMNKYEDMVQQRDYWRNKAQDLEYRLAKLEAV